MREKLSPAIVASGAVFMPRASRTCTLSPGALTCPKQGKEAVGVKQTKAPLYARGDVNTDAALSSRAVARARFCIPVRVRRHLCGRSRDGDDCRDTCHVVSSKLTADRQRKIETLISACNFVEN